MATNTTGASGITYHVSGTGVFTETLVLELYAGTLNSDTAWLDGGAAAASYPGTLDGFQAKNSNSTNATGGLKLVCGTWTTVLADDDKLVVSGNAQKIVAVLNGDNPVAAGAIGLKNAIGTTTLAIPATFDTAGRVADAAQFTVVGSPGAVVQMWMIVQ